MRPVKRTKERCKDAARVRRERERLEFEELAKLLPLPSATTSQLDKASIIRLTSSYLRMRTAFPKGLGTNWGSKEIRSFNKGVSESQLGSCGQQKREIGSLLLQTIEGFVFALQNNGKIMYISETASVHLGLPQMDLTGSSVFEFVHPADHEDLRQVMRLSDREKTEELNSGTYEVARSFCIRMKCVLPKRNAGLAIANFKPIHCTGYLKLKPKLADSNSKGLASLSRGKNSIGIEWESYALVAVGHSLLPSASTEFKLTDSSFMFKASLDFRFYYVEPQITQLLGFNSTDMVGVSLYQFVHASDIDNLKNSHKTLLKRGQAITKYYRLMKKFGGFIWIQSYISIIYYPRHLPKPQNVVSINVVIADDKFDSSCITYEQPIDLKDYLPLGFEPPSRSPQKLGPGAAVSMKHSHGTSLLVAQRQALRRPPSALETKLRQRKQIPKVKEAKTGAARKCSKLKATGNKNTANDNIRQHLKINEYQQELLMPPTTISLRSLRRSSDDTCSVVSSLASTSGCSFTLSLPHHNSDLSTYTTSDSFGSTTITDLTCQLERSPQQESATNTTTTNSGDYENYLLCCQLQPDLDNQPQIAVWSEQQQQQTNETEKQVYNQISSFNDFAIDSPSSYYNETRCLYLQPEAQMEQQSLDNNQQQLVVDTQQTTVYLDGSSYGSGDEQLILFSTSNETSHLNQQPQYYESPTFYSGGPIEPIKPGCSTCMPYQLHHRHSHHRNHQVPIDSGYTLASL